MVNLLSLGWAWAIVTANCVGGLTSCLVTCTIYSDIDTKTLLHCPQTNVIGSIFPKSDSFTWDVPSSLPYMCMRQQGGPKGLLSPDYLFGGFRTIEYLFVDNMSSPFVDNSLEWA